MSPTDTTPAIKLNKAAGGLGLRSASQGETANRRFIGLCGRSDSSQRWQLWIEKLPGSASTKPGAIQTSVTATSTNSA